MEGEGEGRGGGGGGGEEVHDDRGWGRVWWDWENQKGKGVGLKKGRRERKEEKRGEREGRKEEAKKEYEYLRTKMGAIDVY